MIMSRSIACVGVLLLPTLAALGADKPPETVKQAILRAIDLSGGQNLFGRNAKKTADKRSTLYLPVEIRGTQLKEGSIKVVFRLVHWRGKRETTDAFVVQFSSAGITTEPVQPVATTPGLVPEDEHKLCGAVKTVLAKHLRDKGTEVSVQVSVDSERRKLSILISELPLSPGRNRLYIVNERNEIEKSWGGE
jgi:hypothetical protein